MPINFGPGNLVPDPESWFKLLFLLIGYQLELSDHFSQTGTNINYFHHRLTETGI